MMVLMEKFTAHPKTRLGVETILVGFNRRMKQEPGMFFALWYWSHIHTEGSTVEFQDCRLNTNDLNLPKSIFFDLSDTSMLVRSPGQKDPILLVGIEVEFAVSGVRGSEQDRVKGLEIVQGFIDTKSFFRPFFKTTPPPPYVIFLVKSEQNLGASFQNVWVEETLYIFLTPKKLFRLW